MKRSTVAGQQKGILLVTVAIALLAPLLLALTWGTHFSAEVYSLLRLTQNISKGVAMPTSTFASFSEPSPISLLFAAIISIPGRIGADPGWVALIISALGWSMAAISFLAIGRKIQRLRGAVVAALLISFNPSIITTLGTPASWIIALGWLAIALFMRRHLVLAIIAFIFSLALLMPWPPDNSWSLVIQYGVAIAWSILIFAAGFGADWLAQQLAERALTRLNPNQLARLLLVTVFILVGTWQVMRLWHVFRDRPEMLWEIEEDVALWLRTETEPTAMLLSSARVGYLAQRPASISPELHELANTVALQTLLQKQSVDYLVTSNTIPWQQLQETVWFRLAFQPVKHFDNSYLPQAPLTIWALREPIAELGARQEINARVPDRLSLLGYQIGPQQVQAGDTVRMALYFQAPDATARDPVLFQTIVRLISPMDNSTMREWSFEIPQEISPSVWQANDVIIEQFDLDMPPDLEPGAYQFNISLIGADESELWPISLDNDINRLDRIAVGGLIVPLPSEPENYQPLKTIFADKISLSGFSIHEQVPGIPLQVDLFWEALEQIDEDYTIFVHLLNADGQLIASHDNQPDNGRFPTSLWLPGVKIPDRHTIQLPDNLPAGVYELRAGLYQAETGERLIISSSVDQRQEASSLLLSGLSIP